METHFELFPRVGTTIEKITRCTLPTTMFVFVCFVDQEINNNKFYYVVGLTKISAGLRLFSSQKSDIHVTLDY